MIFDVIDPKEHSFGEWIEKVEAFLDSYGQHYERKDGDIYFTQDGIAEPWYEESILYKVSGPEGGMIELRGIDEKFYMFTENFAGRNLKDTKDGHQFNLVAPTSVYGFTHNNLGKIHAQQGNMNKARASYAAALKIQN